MKKIGLGIAILLFAIIISLCSSGMGLLVIGIGIVGLIFSIIVCQLHIGSTCPELLQLNTRRPHSGTPSRKSEKGLLLFFCPK